MSQAPSRRHEWFPASRAGLLAGLAIIAGALLVTAAQAANAWFAGGTVTSIALVALIATLPRGIRPRATRLRAPIDQRRSGWIYGSALILGLALITATLTTEQPWWSLVGGMAFAVATSISLLVAAVAKRGGETPAR